MQILNYTALERIDSQRPVDRLVFLENQVRDKRVFDLGALDETAYQSKKSAESWLHARLCRSATQVIGVDNSQMVPDAGLTTASNGIIIRDNIFDLQGVVDKYGVPDVIVAGELIEHLTDTSSFLTTLKKTPALKGVELLVTTPNACCWHNSLIGLAGRESMHKDHFQVYSYKTLRTLFERHGFSIASVQPYYARFPEMIEDAPAPVAFAAKMFQGVVNALETLAPLLSAGWIVRTRI